MSITQPVMSIPLARIHVGVRLRQVDTDFVDLIAHSLAEHGLITPIEVGPADDEGLHPLVAGAHRLAAARSLGWEAIDARVFEGDQLAAEMREIDENLCRHELSELDRAAFLARRKEVWEALHPDARHGGRRQKGASRQFGDLSFSVQAAEKIGLSERTIQRLIRRHDALHPDVRRRLTGTAFARSGVDLDALAALPHALQLQVLEMIEARGITRVSAALEVLRGQPVRQDADAVLFLRFLKLWRDASRATRERIESHARIELNKLKGEAA